MRLFQLAASFGTGDQVIGLLAHAAGDLGAGGFQQFFGLVTAHVGQRASQHKDLAGQRAGAFQGSSLAFRFRPVQAQRTQALQHLTVVRFGHEAQQAVGHHRADIRHLQQRGLIGLQQGIKAAKVARQVLGRGFADMAYAQAVDKACQRGRLALVQRIQQVLRGFFAHAVQPGQGLQLQRVQIGQAADDLAVHQLLHQLVTQALDVQRAALGKVQHGLLALRAAIDAGGAAGIDLAFFPCHGTAADRAGIGHGKRHRAFRALLKHHRYHFGDHVTGAAHHHGIANAHILAVRLFLVVQRGIGHGHATHKHRLQLGHRCELAGTADLHVDAAHHGQHFLRRVLVRHRPARLAADKAELALQRDAVDLVDHAIDIEGQLVTPFGNLLVKGNQALRALAHHAFFRHRQAEGVECIQHAAVAVGHGVPALYLAPGVGIETQRALHRDGRIELAQRTGGGVARVDKGFFVLRALGNLVALALVQCLEGIAPHIDLAAHFQHGRQRIATQAQRNLPNRAHVLRDVLTTLAIAARGGLHQHALLVAQVHGQTVKLELGGIFDRRLFRRQAQLLAHARVEGDHAAGLGIGLGADRQHRHRMMHRCKARQQLAQHTLRR